MIARQFQNIYNNIDFCCLIFVNYEYCKERKDYILSSYLYENTNDFTEHF